MRQSYRPIGDQTRRPILLKRLLQWASTLSIAGGMTFLHLAVHAELAAAYPRQASVSIAQQGDSYTALVRRAETAARTTAQQFFDGDILVSEVAVTVVGESGSAIVPILTLRVSRDNWRTRPDPQQWSTYFSTARSLLQLGTPTAGSSSTPAPPFAPPQINAPNPISPLAPSQTTAPNSTPIASPATPP